MAETFVSSLVEELKAKKVFDGIDEEIAGSKKTWDTVAKERVGEIVKRVFKQVFPEANVEKAVYIEKKQVRFEKFLGDFVTEKKPYPLFGGLGVYPDIAIKVPTAKPKLIYVELDNGSTGAKLKTALAKAMFGYTTGDCDYCLEIFHNRGKNKLIEQLKKPKEKAILEQFEKSFHTKLIFF